MSSIWYQVCKQFGTAPRAVEFERETDSFLIRKDGRRDAKETTYYKWFPTEAEALAAIADRIEKEESKKAMLRVRNAAPDLLEALEAFERISALWLPAEVEEQHAEEMYALHMARNQMLSAIAKARGDA